MRRFAATLAFLVTTAVCSGVQAAENTTPIVRIFEFVVAPDDLEPFMVAGRKNVEASIRDEPGVLSMHCVADRDEPNKLYVVEVYQNEAAYRSHVATDHFKGFIDTIKGKIASRRVIETTPKVLGSKQFSWTD
ncbi:putative quinol monooxygenase [Rhizobium leguminosarum]|uniref:putative quinol monooxygenase n=1 Tax=Rhizobium leguminosarum TaxID=384 RepID=UPI003F9758EE